MFSLRYDIEAVINDSEFKGLFFKLISQFNIKIYWIHWQHRDSILFNCSIDVSLCVRRSRFIDSMEET